MEATRCLARQKRARPGRLRLLRGRGRPGAEAAEEQRWAPRGARPVVRVRGAGGGRVSFAGVAATGPATGRTCTTSCGCTGAARARPRGSAWADYRDLIIAAHRQLSAPLIWIWDNLNIHLAPELASFAAENQGWLRVYRLPAYAPDLNPAEGIWSLLKRSMVNFAAADLDGLVRIVKRKLKKIQYRPHLIGRLPGRRRPENRTLVTTCTTSSTGYRHPCGW